MVVLVRTAGNTTVPQHCRAEQRREDAEVLLIGADRSAGGQPLRELDGVNAPGSVCARPFAPSIHVTASLVRTYALFRMKKQHTRLVLLILMIRNISNGSY